MRSGGREVLPVRWGGYLLVKRLAVGGMAEVYLAIDEPPLGGRRFVVLKRVREDLADETEYAQFFLTEGRISLKCHHPNLPFAHHLGEADGRAYLVMEYVRGHALLAILRAVAGAGRGLGVASSLAVGIATARALDHLHGLTDVDGAPLDVVHRDVSPHNLIVGDGGVVKLIDLGVARATLQTHHTETGVVKGKYAYMAPEQLVASVRLDARADLFSLGAVMHELLVGRTLFQGHSDLDTCDRVRLAPIAHPSDVRPEVPRAIGDLVMTALERDRERRWPSARALADAFEDAAVKAGVWPSAAGLGAEAVTLLGPAPRPVWDRGTLVMNDGPPESPRVWPREGGTGTVMAVASAEPEAPELIEEEPVTDDLDDAPPPLPAPEPTRRDPALSYYLHVGSVGEGDAPRQRAPSPRGGGDDKK